MKPRKTELKKECHKYTELKKGRKLKNKETELKPKNAKLRI